ncbi:MAG TPA: hypothetical protein VM433_00940 [Mycobacteriales bacterium]|nr:hypothetical protein [Mycobacteriales bacterium]
MALHWRPVGPLPPATYWRRRAVVLLALVAVVALVGWLLGRGGDDTLQTGAPSAAPTGEPAADPTADPAAGDPAPGEPETCADDVLEVETTSDAAQYAPGAAAPLTLTVRNSGDVPCRRALGQGAVELVVTSGQDRIWSSDDCAPGGDEGVVVLEPGGSQSARATWPGTRSAPGCPPDQPVAQPGTYRVNARVGELRVPGAVFTVRP